MCGKKITAIVGPAVVMAGDEGFPVPHTIPAVIGAPPVLGNFHTSEELFEYLKQTHPPQRPGALSDTDYHNVTALL